MSTSAPANANSELVLLTDLPIFELFLATIVVLAPRQRGDIATQRDATRPKISHFCVVNRRHKAGCVPQRVDPPELGSSAGVMLCTAAMVVFRSDQSALGVLLVLFAVLVVGVLKFIFSRIGEVELGH